MDNSLSRQILLSILGIAIFIVAIVGVSYAVFTTKSANINTDKRFLFIKMPPYTSWNSMN